MQVFLVKQSFSCVFQSALEEQGNISLLLYDYLIDKNKMISTVS